MEPAEFEQRLQVLRRTADDLLIRGKSYQAMIVGWAIAELRRLWKRHPAPDARYELLRQLSDADCEAIFAYAMKRSEEILRGEGEE